MKQSEGGSTRIKSAAEPNKGSSKRRHYSEKVIEYTVGGWIEIPQENQELRNYYMARSELSITDDELLLYKQNNYPGNNEK